MAAEICEHVEEYPWSSLQILLGKKRGIIPLIEDATLFSSTEIVLNWLNQAYDKVEAKDLKAAFRKKQFEFSNEMTTNRKNQLAKVESIQNLQALNYEMLAGTFNEGEHRCEWLPS